MKAICALSLLAIAPPALACDPTALLVQIQADSYRPDSDDCWNKILERIATGNAEWLEAAVRLSKHADGSGGEELLHALGTAMQIAPSRVLPLVNSSAFFSTAVCLPDAFDDKTIAARPGVLRKAEPMFEGFLQTKYKQQAAACLAEVRKERAHGA